MGTISARARADGTIAYRAEVVIRLEGKRHKFTATFDRESAAKKWIVRKEKEVRQPGFQRKRPSTTVSDAIDHYTADASRIGRTKAQVLRALKADSIADMDCRDVGTEALVDLARRLSRERTPQTVGNYMSHLSGLFSVARPAWGHELNQVAMQEAMVVCKRIGLITRSRKRNRRPTLDEMSALMAYFKRSPVRSIPMHTICAFALYSTRRQDEITRLRRADHDPQHGLILVRDMKHPGEKDGNDVWCELPPEAARILGTRQGEIFFPYSSDSISARFTRACKVLGIEDLRFHDLRHEGVSRLAEVGRTVPQIASVSGHRDWKSLQRYSHLRAVGDKWAGWEWLDRIAPPARKAEDGD